MKEVTAFDSGSPNPAAVCWENLEEFARLKIQEFLQGLLEEEVTSLLGRPKSERREVAPDEAGNAAPALHPGWPHHRAPARGPGAGRALREPDPAAVPPADRRGGSAAAGALPPRQQRSPPLSHIGKAQHLN